MRSPGKDMSPVGQGLGDTARQMKTMKVLFTGLAVGHYQPMADGDALHIARTKASSVVENLQKTLKNKCASRCFWVRSESAKGRSQDQPSYIGDGA